MRKTLYIIAFALASILTAGAQEVVNIHRTDKSVTALSLSVLDSISFSADESETYFHTGNNVTTFRTEEIDSLTFGMVSRTVFIHYDGTEVTVTNPLADNGVSITVDGADVTVNSTLDEEVEYVLTGTATDGSFKLYGEKKFILTLSGVTLTNSDGPAINIQSGKKGTVQLVSGTVNTLTDGSTYTACGSEDMKATFFSEGQLVFTGTGTLCVSGNKKHGICSDDYVLIEDGNLILTNIVSDGIHANDYIRMDGGTVQIAASSDGMDGDTGYIEINGGTLVIDVAGDTSKGIKCDSTVTITGGDITIRTTGNTVVEDNDPSYCTAIKSDMDVFISGGTLTITATGLAGRGISADGNVEVSGGTVSITTSGNGSTYTNTSNTKDSYSAACIKADGDVFIQDGTLTLSSSGTAGKGISADGAVTIGDDTHCPNLTVKTTGKKFTVSGSDYANPKAVKSEGAMTVNNGNLTVSTTQDGGEGLESKTTMTINGGTLELTTYDDGINAASALVINGGKIYANASNNDGIDSNGTITITGGLIITSGTSTPEEGIDCDQNRFAITGGTLIATGGATSTPTTSACTQRSIVYNGSALSGKVIHLQDASGNGIVTYQAPTKSALSSQVVVLISTPDLQASTSYTLYTGGTVSGTEYFHGLYTDATYTAGTQVSTFTTTNMVTTVGSSSSGGPGGGGGGFPGGGRPW